MDMKQRGHRAEELLSDPLLVETLDLIEQSLTQSWKESTETTAREELWYTLRGHQRFKEILTVTMESGKYQEALEEKRNAQSTT